MVTCLGGLGPYHGGHGGIAQLVERQLCKLDVRSSSLLASTMYAYPRIRVAIVSLRNGR